MNHVYHSLPQTPLMGFTSPSDVPHNQRHYSMTQPKPQPRQKECLLGEHRRRSNSGGEKKQHQVPTDAATSQSENNEPHNSNERDSNGHYLSVDSENASSSRFKFLPLLVNSHSSENFNQLRRVAMATVCCIFYLILLISFFFFSFFNVSYFLSCRRQDDTLLSRLNYSVTNLS